MEAGQAPVTVPVNWRDEAACRGDPAPDDRFLAQGPGLARAQAICSTCPVQVSCLDSSMTQAEAHGLWGGLGVDDRLDLGLIASDPSQWAGHPVLRVSNSAFQPGPLPSAS